MGVMIDSLFWVMQDIYIYIINPNTLNPKPQALNPSSRLPPTIPKFND